MNRNIFAALSSALLVGFLTGCTTPNIRQGNLTSGVLEVDVPENFAGVGKNVPQNSTVRNITLGLDYTTHDEMKMSGAKNEKLQFSDYDVLVSENSKENYTVLPETKIKNFRYKRNRFPVSVSYTSLNKKETFIHGFSVGIDPTLYGRYILGINKESFEVGGFVDVGLNFFNDNSFDYYECEKKSEEKGCEEKSEIKHLDQENQGGARAGAGLYASAYISRFAVSYSPAIYKPNSDLTEEYEDTHELRFRVDEPWILNQYMGVSTWISDSWKISLGATVLSPLDLDDFYWTVNGSLGYWF